MNFIGLHCVAPRKIERFIITAVRTSSPIKEFYKKSGKSHLAISRNIWERVFDNIGVKSSASPNWLNIGATQTGSVDFSISAAVWVVFGLV